MSIKKDEVIASAKRLFEDERKINRLEGWFLSREAVMLLGDRYANLPDEERAACELLEMVRQLPISINDNAVFAGTQRDAFARSYALINPSFRVKSFNGYCDPTAVFSDIEPSEELPAERIEAVRSFTRSTTYVRRLTETYDSCEDCTAEVAFFVEQVTGHLIPDFRPALSRGLRALTADAHTALNNCSDPIRRSFFTAAITAMEAAMTLAGRYASLASELAETRTGADRERLMLIARTCERVPAEPAKGLYEALQSYMLLWQTMCLEQAPNPFAFSVGGADRIFEPYREAEGMSREEAAALFAHFLVFFNVGDRSWAISQNILIGGRDISGKDLTNTSSLALLDAYFTMNLPQPILSVKLHKNTPRSLYAELGRFFFSPGVLTPSLFNDDSVFELLRARGVEDADLADYSVAGCQEPLICGKDNGNTTNSWLNMAKILELTLTGGVSGLTGQHIHVPATPSEGADYDEIERAFYTNLEYFTERMTEAANGAAHAIEALPVPFLSSFMGGLEYGYDLRDTSHTGTKYNGSGCLIHGLSTVTDSLVAIRNLLRDRPEDYGAMIEGIKTDFAGLDELRAYLRSQPKYGNNNDCADTVAAELAQRSADIVASKKNLNGNSFRPDFSSPTTHLLYGYWVAATPDGRAARAALGYGVDPMFGEATQGMGLRILSNFKLPFEKMCGGYASHLGIDPKYFNAPDTEGKGLQFADRVITPLFFNEYCPGMSPFYLYVNVTTPEILRKLLENPKKYAPTGVYIMRIHGTFVNFLDLSPEIQQDIINRLDPASATINGCDK